MDPDGWRHMTRLMISTLALLTAAPVLAQDAPPLPPGAEVRVRSPVASGRYVVHDHRVATLMLRDSAGVLVNVPVASVTRLSVLRGRRSAGAGALRGAGIGLLAGAGTGFLYGYATVSTGSYPFSPMFLGVVLGTFGAGIGTAAGAVIGLIYRGEKWETVPLNTIRAGPSTDGGMTLSLGIRF